MTISFEDWKKKGRELFGEDSKQWKFKCPICETSQSIRDFIDAGVDEDEARDSIAFECIGRHLPKEETQSAFKSGKKFITGKPCDYAGYGLFKLNPVKVKLKTGTIIKVFDFDYIEV